MGSANDGLRAARSDDNLPATRGLGEFDVEGNDWCRSGCCCAGGSCSSSNGRRGTRPFQQRAFQRGEPSPRRAFAIYGGVYGPERPGPAGGGMGPLHRQQILRVPAGERLRPYDRDDDPLGEAGGTGRAGGGYRCRSSCWRARGFGRPPGPARLRERIFCCSGRRRQSHRAAGRGRCGGSGRCLLPIERMAFCGA